MLFRFWFIRCLFSVLAVWLGVMVVSLPAQASGIDPYVSQYLRATEPVALKWDEKGETRLFSPADLSQGKQLFKTNCINCHVGGTTLPDPSVSLSLETLQGANPPRDNIGSLVAFMRQPMSYDGSTEAYLCRQVTENWLSQKQVENLAAFILRAAEKAPGWGKEGS